jgi:hypothetical protein
VARPLLAAYGKDKAVVPTTLFKQDVTSIDALCLLIPGVSVKTSRISSYISGEVGLCCSLLATQGTKFHVYKGVMYTGKCFPIWTSSSWKPILVQTMSQHRHHYHLLNHALNSYWLAFEMSTSSPSFQLPQS